MAKKPHFKMRKVSNYGSSHPVVARLLLQTHDLLQWADLSREDKDSIMAIYDGLKQRLIKCHESRDRLVSSLKTTIGECEFKEDGSSRYEPHVIGLKEEVETILYEAKNYLRDLLGILHVYFGYKCDEASYLYDAKGKGRSPLVRWSSEKFGEDDPFTEMLATEHEWVEEVIRKRNAVEHPGGHSGTLYIHNFVQREDGKYVMPTWHRDDGEPKGIYPDIDTILDNLLTLAEDFLVSCNVHKTKHKVIQYVSIPADQRDPQCPKRIMVQLKEGTGPAGAN